MILLPGFDFVAPYGFRPITAPFAAGASNQTVSMCRNPASSSHAEYSAGV
jgi:hypothetical protein